MIVDFLFHRLEQRYQLLDQNSMQEDFWTSYSNTSSKQTITQRVCPDKCFIYCLVFLPPSCCDRKCFVFL